MIFFEPADTGIHFTIGAATFALIADRVWSSIQAHRNTKGEKGEMRESLVGNKLDVIAGKLDAQTTIANSQTALLNELVLNSRVEAELRKRENK